MRIRSCLSALLLGLIAFGNAWCEPGLVSEARGSLSAGEAASDSDHVASRINPAAHIDLAAAYQEHAPLAWFSLGSLAVGGVFYAISRGLDRPNVSYAAGNRSQMTTAVALAGASAALAAGSYFYYVHKSKTQAEPVSDWEASMLGAPDGAGGLAVAARISLPLPSLR